MQLSNSVQDRNTSLKQVQTITNRINMQEVLYTRDASWQSNEEQFNKGIRKNVSYNKYEDHIQRIEKDLMKKHRLGYSALVKFLILKEGQQQFGIPFLAS